MPFLGSKSGFKTVRDVILFATGLGIDIYHVATTAPAELSIPLLLFGGGLAGVTSVLKYDEKKE